MIENKYHGIRIEDFKMKMQGFESNLSALFVEGNLLDVEIQNQLKGLGYEES
ncbi:MAG TPA: hypothetical protein VNI52_14320 [Sphingobacteriaceae bacterium]|nr:hypothetical protein [Sphingobacteriaceae bacterium]